MKITVYPLDILERKGITKKELAELMGIKDKCFDYALPQDWLNHFVDKHKLKYDIVLSTTFMVYEGQWASPVSGCLEVSRYLDDDISDIKDLFREYPEYQLAEEAII